MKIWYMNGAGNDFMVVDARGLDLDFSLWFPGRLSLTL